MTVFGGTPLEIGRKYGEYFKSKIVGNIEKLVFSDKVEKLKTDSGFHRWIAGQEAYIESRWPWLTKEMTGIAGAAGVSYKDILMLNLRAWQYDCYGAEPISGCCSSFAVTVEDGTVVCAGALDDPAEYYCGPIQVMQQHGYSYITFPITGTSWGNRGMNSEGLSIGISSQLLPGLEKLEHTMNQDLAVRILLQTCAKVSEVREFCRQHPFTMNLVCVDASGDIFCAHQTAAGLFELPSDGFAAMTNHIADDECRYFLKRNGVKEFPESPTTHLRRGNILRFLRENNRKCTTKDVLDFVGTRDDDNPDTVNNKGTIYLTCSNPQQDKNCLWIRQVKSDDGKDAFEMHVL